MRRALRAVSPGANGVSAGGTRLLDVVVFSPLIRPTSDPRTTSCYAPRRPSVATLATRNSAARLASAPAKRLHQPSRD
jgi:hypothetical protein